TTREKAPADSGAFHSLSTLSHVPCHSSGRFWRLKNIRERSDATKCSGLTVYGGEGAGWSYAWLPTGGAMRRSHRRSRPAAASLGISRSLLSTLDGWRASSARSAAALGAGGCLVG